MPIRPRLYALIYCLGLCNSGCTLPAHTDPELMMLLPVDLEGVKHNPSLSKLVLVDKVVGGAAPEPSWHVAEVYDDDFQEALASSLETAGYDANAEQAHYALSAFLKDMERPTAGFEITVNTNIQYRLVDRKTNATLFDGLIRASYTTPYSDGYIGQTRIRHAQERATRKNIQQLMIKLGTLNVKAAAPTAPPAAAR